MKGFDDLTKREQENVLNSIDTYTDNDLESMYEDMLDDVYGEVEIAGLSYSTSYALKELDLIAYREGFNNWIDTEEIIELDSDVNCHARDMESALEEYQDSQEDC